MQRVIFCTKEQGIGRVSAGYRTAWGTLSKTAVNPISMRVSGKQGIAVYRFL
jgi:hypothetical protein